MIDSDQHLVEYRGLWEEHCDPSGRDDAIHFVDDENGWTQVVWRGQQLGLAEVQTPGETTLIGGRHRDFREGRPAPHRYDELLPDDHWKPAARVARLDQIGLDEAVVFPNYGLLWERTLSSSLDATKLNMHAWNRWAGVVIQESRGRLHPVAHLTLRDLDWLEQQLVELSAAGVRLAMIAPAVVDDKPLSHPDLDRAWSMFVDQGISPIFHVADQTRPFDDAWYTDAGNTFVPTVDSVFLWTAAALACTDLIVNGVFETHPDLRLGIVELSAIWVPQFLLMLDGGVDFTTKLNGAAPVKLSRRPSEYFYENIRVSSFAYELPERITRHLGGRELLMACSDYPHSEGTATPLDDYANSGPGLVPDANPDLFGGNVRWLLRR